MMIESQALAKPNSSKYNPAKVLSAELYSGSEAELARSSETNNFDVFSDSTNITTGKTLRAIADKYETTLMSAL